MATRSTNKILLLIIIVLLITNIMMLILFVLPSQKKKHHERTSNENGFAITLKDSVGFSDEQVAEYLKLRSEERPQLKQYFSGMRSAKEKFYNTLLEPVDDSSMLALADSIGSIQKQTDIHMLNYFNRIRQICTPEQLPAFDSTITRIVNKMIGRQGRNKNSQIKKHNK